MKRLVLAGLVMVAAVLAGCAGVEPASPNHSDRYTMSQDAAPAMKVDPASIRDAVPRAEPVTSAGNKSPYTVLGKTYHVMASSHGYSEVGTASWYGAKFHGHKTSNGETYSMYDMSAAHKTLPIPCYVKVTNLDNGRTAVVRVNDRGPFKDGRLIDLSYAAATKLGYVDKGTARVRVEAIDTAKGAPPVSLAASRGGMSQAADGARYLQVGAFRDEYSANRLRDEIDQVLQYAVFVQQVTGQNLFRVRIGPFFTDAELLAVQQMLAAAQYGRALIVSE